MKLTNTIRKRFGYFNSLLLALCLMMALNFSTRSEVIKRVEPSYWWTGMKNSSLQLLIYGDGIGQYEVQTFNNLIKITHVIKPENKNYLFLYLDIDPKTQPGFFDLIFTQKGKKKIKYQYELKARKSGSATRQGIGKEDIIYLLMPDRFANGNRDNDNIPGMLEKADRSNPDGRHGGDIQGITGHLNYIKNLGATTVWINPLLENNQAKYSYHGYAISDFYKVDPRFGSNQDYFDLVGRAHDLNMKIIMDMVFNHCGSGHWWMKDIPNANWINQWPEFTRSNYRAGTILDPHGSAYDKNRMQKGWFDANMPDLNTEDSVLAIYLIQNTIWWIEAAGVDGLRIDTYPYPNGDFMTQWADRVFEEYPDLGIIGEAWLNYPAFVAYFQKNANNANGFNSKLPMVFDFPLYYALSKAFTEEDGWDKGLLRLYEILTQDFLYPDPSNLVVMADNHDLSRFYSNMDENLSNWKMGITFLLTTRGIPLIYYGTEILMRGFEHDGHGQIRKDFPGGWENDVVNTFTGNGLTDVQKEAKSFLSTLLKYRQGSEALKYGKLTQFIPEDGLYVYFRYTENKTVMVMINKSEQVKQPDMSRFFELTSGFIEATDIISGKKSNLSDIKLEPQTASIFELK